MKDKVPGTKAATVHDVRASSERERAQVPKRVQMGAAGGFTAPARAPRTLGRGRGLHRGKEVRTRDQELPGGNSEQRQASRALPVGTSHLLRGRDRADGSTALRSRFLSLLLMCSAFFPAVEAPPRVQGQWCSGRCSEAREQRTSGTAPLGVCARPLPVAARNASVGGFVP